MTLRGFLKLGGSPVFAVRRIWFFFFARGLFSFVRGLRSRFFWVSSLNTTVSCCAFKSCASSLAALLGGPRLLVGGFLIVFCFSLLRGNLRPESYQSLSR